MKQYFQQDNKWVCSVCNKDFNSRQATTSHIHRAHTKPGIAYGGHKKGTPAWNKGLVGVQEAWNKGKPGTFTGRKHTDETKQKISEKLSVNNKGGRAKWYDVAGQRVQGTWEQQVALKLEELGIKWIKLKTNKDVLKYVMDGKVRSYTPDFYLQDYSVYLEVKGFWWGRDKEKMQLVKEAHKDKNIVIVERDMYERLLQGELVWSFQRQTENL